MLVTSSHFLRGPIPMMVNSSKPPLRLATALPETGTGMEGNLGSPDAPRRIAAPSTGKAQAGSFFIQEIIPHMRGSTSMFRRFLEPGFAAVLAVSVAECGFENMGFAAGTQRLHDNESQKDEPEDGPMQDQH